MNDNLPEHLRGAFVIEPGQTPSAVASACSGADARLADKALYPKPASVVAGVVRPPIVIEDDEAAVSPRSSDGRELRELESLITDEIDKRLSRMAKFNGAKKLALKAEVRVLGEVRSTVRAIANREASLSQKNTDE